MVSVAARIEQAPACEVINLSDDEKLFYSGAGWKLARFIDGKLVGLFDPLKTPTKPDKQTMADEMLTSVLAWLVNAEGEVWLVSCSCMQLCEPRLVDPSDASSIAHMARVFADQLAEDF